MALQQHFIAQESDILKELDEMFQNDELYKTQTKESVINELFSKWLESFVIKNPDDYFVQNNIDDDDIMFNI